MSAPLTLEQVAAAREEWREAVETHEARVEELRKPYHAEAARLARAREELARTELALATAKRAHFIGVAAQELGITTEEPPVLIVAGYRLPDVYELVALSQDGTGLYLHKPERLGRSGGKRYAIRQRHVPEQVRAIIEDHEDGLGSNVRGALERREARLMALGFPRSAGLGIRPVYGWRDGSSGLWEWSTRAKGDFGENGAVKPAMPPDGSKRWRWLKVREQDELPAGLVAVTA